MVKLHPNSISRILKAAGLEQSKSWATRIRGWHHSSAGFYINTTWGEKTGWRNNRNRWRPGQPNGWVIKKADTSVVKDIQIGWRFGDWARGDLDEIRIAHFTKITKALEAAGYTVECVNNDCLRIGVKAA